uniref:MADF domain-containing protein n=1 Tax=Timema poppense TaxID=170557 RepID=A0A7R9D8A4_TIMPO|nr:unnamed protein product [Timema poppensis]
MEEEMEHCYSTNKHFMQEDIIDGDAVLVELVRRYPNLYMSSNKMYKDLTVRENSWSDIAAVMSKSVKECQTRWVRLRERYAREKRREFIESSSGETPVKKKEWHLLKDMEFLSPHVKRRKCFFIVPTITSDNIEESNSANELEDSQPPAPSLPPPSLPPPSPSSSTIIDDQLNEDNKEVINEENVDEITLPAPSVPVQDLVDLSDQEEQDPAEDQYQPSRRSKVRAHTTRLPGSVTNPSPLMNTRGGRIVPL